MSRGLEELATEAGERGEPGRIGQAGGGRKSKTVQDKALKGDISRMIAASRGGDPETPLLWTSQRTRALAAELNQDGPRVSPGLGARLLDEMDDSLQGPRKVKEGSDQPDRAGQFRFMAEKTQDFQQPGPALIAVETKKKDRIGASQNRGQAYPAQGQPAEVNVPDFMAKEKGKATPAGVYDLSKNKGWVRVGIRSDTAELAVNSLRPGGQEMGVESDSHAPALDIKAEGGGRYGSRGRGWKTEWQRFANEIGQEIHVAHFPPGTRKGNKIEPKMFWFISKNGRGKPLLDTATIVQLIGNTPTTKGLIIRARLDDPIDQKSRKVTDEEFQKIALEPDPFHGEWNYTILPQV